MIRELSVGIELVKEASLLSVEIQRVLTVSAMQKDDRSPVTVADFSVQALISHRLKEAFPEDKLVGEEDGDFLKAQEPGLRESVTKYVGSRLSGANELSVARWINRGAAKPCERFWLIDPVDGTKGFLRGGQYAVALALLVDYQVEVGVLGCPNLKIDLFDEPGVIFYAAKGEGTWALPLEHGFEEATRVRVSTCSRGNEARMLFSYESSHTNVNVVSGFITGMGIDRDPLRIDSQAKQGLLAAGEGEFLLRVPPAESPGYKEKIWDQAAGMIVIEEAGGRVTDLDGKPLDFSAGLQLVNNRGILCSNGVLHERALQVLEAVSG